MFINELFDAYKTAKNYVQDKQIAHDLGLSSARISEMRKGKRYVSDSEAVILAEVAGYDIKEVLIRIAADQAKDAKAQNAWGELLEKLKGQQIHNVSLSILGLLALDTPTIQCVLSILC
ncbi:DUF3693 domain-containing protein [Enterovibrio paralichthyis]|uniref:DUF3693 domain-containing protein n=1 Tax=Enterovibrio paralichthyis TaxID=2853805 RepID=UPI001C473037|nr:DUF3693 domain-containing protein [Enterovibrio paralichthyis]MBV7296609.1 hypothetical protein [Enterovibrio paralichthyis]